MSESRSCVCGCGTPARPGSKYALDHHRNRVYRRKVVKATEQVGLPAHLNLSTLTEEALPRVGDTQRPARKRSRRSPDLRVSYRKAVAAISDGMRVVPSDAEAILRPLLTARQREALEQRQEVIET